MIASLKAPDRLAALPPAEQATSGSRLPGIEPPQPATQGNPEEGGPFRYVLDNLSTAGLPPGQAGILVSLAFPPNPSPADTRHR